MNIRLLPMNRLYDELNKVDQHRKKETACARVIQQCDFDLLKQEEKNLKLNLLLAEVRATLIDFYLK